MAGSRGCNALRTPFSSKTLTTNALPPDCQSKIVLRGTRLCALARGTTPCFLSTHSTVLRRQKVCQRVRRGKALHGICTKCAADFLAALLPFFRASDSPFGTRHSSVLFASDPGLVRATLRNRLTEQQEPYRHISEVLGRSGKADGCNLGMGPVRILRSFARTGITNSQEGLLSDRA